MSVSSVAHAKYDSRGIGGPRASARQGRFPHSIGSSRAGVSGFDHVEVPHG